MIKARRQVGRRFGAIAVVSGRGQGPGVAAAALQDQPPTLTFNWPGVRDEAESVAMKVSGSADLEAVSMVGPLDCSVEVR